MSEQLQINLAPPVTSDPETLWLEELLKGAHCWMTAKDIAFTTHGRVSDRDLRDLASASSEIISGQKGYKWIGHATPEEINHAANWLEAQAKKMSERAGRIRKRAHQLFG